MLTSHSHSRSQGILVFIKKYVIHFLALPATHGVGFNSPMLPFLRAANTAGIGAPNIKFARIVPKSGHTTLKKTPDIFLFMDQCEWTSKARKRCDYFDVGERTNHPLLMLKLR